MRTCWPLLWPVRATSWWIEFANKCRSAQPANFAANCGDWARPGSAMSKRPNGPSRKSPRDNLGSRKRTVSGADFTSARYSAQRQTGISRSTNNLSWPRSFAKIVRGKRTRGEACSPIAFSFADMRGQANDYLGTVRTEAAKIVQQAHQQAEQIRRQAEVAGRKAAEAAIERVLDERVGKRDGNVASGAGTSARRNE